jgi:DNA-binding response OmpR family regulator
VIKSRARILVVDDDPDLLLLLRSTLEYEGFSTAVAADGGIAIDRIEQDPPHMVLLDIMMPNVDGWAVLDACARKRGAPRFIVVSAKATDEDRARAFELGAAEFVTKPFDPHELIRTVLAVLSRSNDEIEGDRVRRLSRLRSNEGGAGESGEVAASG